MSRDASSGVMVIPNPSDIKKRHIYENADVIIPGIDSFLVLNVE
jgi:hypothetical protein